MIRTQKKLMTGILMLMVAVGVSGCFGAKRVVVMHQPTCSQALIVGLHHYSDEEISTLLDKAVAENDTQGCFIPLITHSLNENRHIDRRHLTEAVKIFNQRRYNTLFHKAMYRYFAELAKYPESYRPQDRTLLETYLSHLINTAENSADEQLAQAKLLCRTLDSHLYARLFE